MHPRDKLQLSGPDLTAGGDNRLTSVSSAWNGEPGHHVAADGINQRRRKPIDLPIQSAGVERSRSTPSRA
jgi:hypothetical protein